MSDPTRRPLRRRTGRLALAATTAAVLLAGGAAGVPASAEGHPAGASWLPGTPPGWPQVVDFSRTPTRTVTRGVTHYSETYDTVGGRQHTQVLDVNLSDPNVRLGVVQAGDTITDPADETVSSMAGRTHAVAGVNGDYFEIHGTGRPLGGVISDGVLMKTPKPGFASQLGVKPDGSLVMGPEKFSGTITDGAASHTLTSVNTVNDLSTGGITEVTSYLGDSTGLTSATLVLGHTTAAGEFTVDTVTTPVTSVARLASGQLGLLGAGAGGRWLTANVRPGDTVKLATAISPDNDLTQLISGVTTLVKDGQVYQDPTGTPPSGPNPETAIGISRDGEHATLVTLDGRAGAATAFGVTPAQVAGYLVAHGAYTGELFDGGGSTEMVTREPGDTQVSVANTPSDPGHAERPVGDGVFVYTTAAHAGPPAHLVVNDGGQVTTLAGGVVPVPVYATDKLGNPATGTPVVRVVPASLATWSDGRLTPHRPGAGRITATDGGVTTSQPLRVVAAVAHLAISPDAAQVAAGATQQFTLAASTRSGAAVDLPAGAAQFSVDQPALGAVDTGGLFTADAHHTGTATVTATAAGATATAVVTVGAATSGVVAAPSPGERHAAAPENPSWLRFQETADAFGPGGETLLTGGGARLTASGGGSSGAAVMNAVTDRLASLSPRAVPDRAQLLGDMAADGRSADLQAARSAAGALGVPARDAVGAGETGQGAEPENAGFAAVFGDTHYAYTAGPARVIVTDSSHGSLQSSDPYQNPAGSQYPWLVDQLTRSTARAVIVATSLPAYDPHAGGTSAFSDRWEARMYLRLVQKYQLSHPAQHVVMLYGASGGYAEQVLDPTGGSVGARQGGIPQFTFGGLAAGAGEPADQGGFAGFGLLHVTPSGDVRFTVEPVLSAIRVDAAGTTVAAGAEEPLTATGAGVGGDGGADAAVPIADPASHVWSSADPSVASVDPVTGVVTGHRAGTATVSVTSGGVTGSVVLTVD